MDRPWQRTALQLLRLVPPQRGFQGHRGGKVDHANRQELQDLLRRYAEVLFPAFLGRGKEAFHRALQRQGNPFELSRPFLRHPVFYDEGGRMTRAAPAVNLFSGIVALAIFAAGVWTTTEVARYPPNT